MKKFSLKEKKHRPVGTKPTGRKVVFCPDGQRRAGLIRQILGNQHLQPKLKVSNPNDAYEQEADRVADAVMRIPDETLSLQPLEEEEELVQTKPVDYQACGSDLQRQVEEEEEELQMKTGLAAGKGQMQENKGEVSSELVESRIRMLHAGGRQLNEQERNFFEPRFGVDLSHVRLHPESMAANAATAIGARAFTVGNHIAIAGGEYNFSSSQGKQLMAHELTHVLQNGSQDTVHRNPVAGMKAAEWLATAALGYVVAQDAVASASGDISWKLDEMNGVLLPGGRTDVEQYKKENPGLTVQTKELVVSFWEGTKGSRKAGIKFGLAFNTDGKGIGNVSSRVIDTHDWPMWSATCTVDLMPQTFVSENGKAVIRVTLTNSWDNSVSNGVASEIWNLEGNGNFTRVKNDRFLRVEHSLS